MFWFLIAVIVVKFSKIPHWLASANVFMNFLLFSPFLQVVRQKQSQPKKTQRNQRKTGVEVGVGWVCLVKPFSPSVALWNIENQLCCSALISAKKDFIHARSANVNRRRSAAAIIGNHRRSSSTINSRDPRGSVVTLWARAVLMPSWRLWNFVLCT